MPGVDACQGEARGRAEALRVVRRGGRLEVGGRAVEGQFKNGGLRQRSNREATGAAGEKAGSRLASASLAYVCGLGGPLRASKTRANLI